MKTTLKQITVANLQKKQKKQQEVVIYTD